MKDGEVKEEEEEVQEEVQEEKEEVKEEVKEEEDLNHLASVVVGAAAEDVTKRVPGEGPDACFMRSLLSTLTGSDGLVAVGGPVENGTAARKRMS